MPFYEYQCTACGHQHEELQRITDGALRKCPVCGRSALRRLMSAPAFRLKGSGWYETDFKGDKDSQRNIAGEKAPTAELAPTVEKPKDDQAAAPPVEQAPAADTAPKPAADSKPKPAASKTTPARRRRAIRRPGR